MYQALRLFVLPPLLTLAIVAPTLMLFTNYLSHQSAHPTYVVASLQQAKPCAFCHSGFFERSGSRLAALRFRVSAP